MPRTFAFEAIGTGWRIDIEDETSDGAGETLRRRVLDRIAEFDLAYSRFRSDSLISRMAREAGEYRLPDDAAPMLDLYRSLYDLTGGAFTPLIGRMMVEAGYDAEYSMVPKELHAPPRWDDVMEVRHPVLTMKTPALLDVGAIGKGYLIDLVGELIASSGIRRFCIDAGGDILRRGDGELRVGLEDPQALDKVIGAVGLGNGSLCGSSGSRRAWDRFHHIMDPRTLDSARRVEAAWTRAKTAMLADAMATCLFLVPPEVLRLRHDFEYLVLYPDRRVVASPGFGAETFS